MLVQLILVISEYISVHNIFFRLDHLDSGLRCPELVTPKSFATREEAQHFPISGKTPLLFLYLVT